VNELPIADINPDVRDAIALAEREDISGKQLMAFDGGSDTCLLLGKPRRRHVVLRIDVTNQPAAVEAVGRGATESVGRSHLRERRAHDGVAQRALMLLEDADRSRARRVRPRMRTREWAYHRSSSAAKRQCCGRETSSCNELVHLSYEHRTTCRCEYKTEAASAGFLAVN
jgi:hypothetical protein